MAAPRLTVLGTGYLGATHAVCMAELGFEVLGLDVDADKVAKLSDGAVPFYEPGLDRLLRANLDTGRLRFTTSYDDVAAFGDVHFLCVGTPQKHGEYAADMRYVNGSLDALLPRLTRPCTIAGKSTVPVGTAEGVAERIKAEAPAGDAIELVWNPEFLREGFAVEDTLRPDRLVIGVTSPAGEATMREVYAKILANGTPMVVGDMATAQLVKVAANAFLATKISFINAMAEVCEVTHADVTKLSEALSYDTRIGGRFLNAGLGFGGGCLPKDIRAFMARAGELGVDQALSFLTEVDAINLRRRARMVDLTRELLDDTFLRRKVAVLGAAFKPDSDDIRDSPALDVASRLQKHGADVRVYDPAAMDNARRMYPDLSYSESALDAAAGADVVLHLTEWAEFCEMDPGTLAAVVAQRNIVDGRNALDPERWRTAGWTYRALGRP
ncbi:MAG: UDP-glucose/GDP-mannose dehydrogenase family protein [Frankiaceae bacterium]|nr:UDP-glucose/GDP-mannose dehydrogenase family protein [Frankiaceae bacterium]MBV9872243.1 UDP-glucose/GDP-mannose dehydrogenase family protein [Frankiaceae bacterium]